VKATLQADKATYEAGSPILLTVTLKDAQDNLVPGQVDKLTAETVTAANATAGKWAETTLGTYSATYTAKTAGTGLKAHLTLGSVTAVTPTPYAITGGPAVYDTSRIMVDRGSYASGSNIKVTVVLRDVASNPVVGQERALSFAVAVGHATLNTAWREEGNGVYAAIYTATSVGEGLVASVKLSDWRTDKSSSTYIIRAGVAAEAASDIETDKMAYATGETMRVTVTLKDAWGNSVMGQAASLNAMTVDHATLKGRWNDASNGMYYADYTATTVGEGLTARVKLRGWLADKASNTYAIYGLPTIDRVNISGSGKFNEELEAQVAGFNANGTGYDDSRYQWYYKNANGSWSKPDSPAAKQRRWTPDKSYINYTVRVGVTPKGTAKTVLGREVFSAAKAIYGVPDAENVKLDQTVVAGHELQIHYTFIANGTGQNASEYRWYWHDDYADTWKRIDGVTTDKWVVPVSYAGYRIKAEVIPRSSRGDVGISRSSNLSRALGKLPTPTITWSACWKTFFGEKELAFTWDTKSIPTYRISLVTVPPRSERPSNIGEFNRQPFSPSTIEVYFKDEYGYTSNSVTLDNFVDDMLSGCNTMVRPN
jgi:hypothetical protein